MLIKDEDNEPLDFVTMKGVADYLKQLKGKKR